MLGLIREADRSIREKMEEHVVGDLKEMGYNAVCSCDEFSPKVFENMDEKDAVNKLNGGGIDAVLTIVLLDKSREKYYVPGKVYYSPYFLYQSRFWGYYRTMYERIYSPGYYVVDTKYFWESNFYNLTSKKLLYSAQSQSFDPSTAENMAHEYGKMIVKNMEKNNIIVKQENENTKPM